MSSLYLRLSGFYLFYFASLGVLLPYWSLYLQSLGFGPVQIGQLMAIFLATKLVAPNIWGWLSDLTGRRMSIIRAACMAAACSFIGVYWANDSFGRLALVMLLFSFFWNAALPQFEAITLNHLSEKVHRYSRIRLWGSIGFIVMSVAVGASVQRLGLSILPTILLVLLVAIWLMSLTVPERKIGNPSAGRESLSQVLRQPRVVSLLIVCFLVQASHGPYYAFFSIYLEDLGYRPSVIGWLWGLSVVAEVGVFLFMHRLLPYFGARRLMLAALALTCLRWLLIGGFAAYLGPLLLAQCLHAFSFGVYHAVAIDLIHSFFPGPYQGRGQALYSSLSFGAGGGLGNLAAGYLWDGLGPRGTYALAAGLGAIGLIVAWRGLRA